MFALKMLTNAITVVYQQFKNVGLKKKTDCQTHYAILEILAVSEAKKHHSSSKYHKCNKTKMNTV